MRCAKPTHVLLLALAGATGLYAGTITLNTQLTSKHTEDGINLQVKITNAGDAPAHDLLVEAVLGDVTAISEQPALKPGATFNAQLDLGAAPRPPGIHTVVVYLRYVDAGGHPSTSVQSVPVVSPNIDRDVNHAYAKLQATEAEDQAELALHLESQTGNALDAVVSLLLPDEIGCESPPRQRITIPATGSTSLEFTLGDVHSHTRIQNRVGVMIDSVHDGYHGSTVLWVPLTIEPSHHHHLRVHHLGLPLLLLLAGGAFILAQFPRTAPRVRFLDLNRYPLVQRVFPASVFVILVLFIDAHVPISFLFQNTVLTGGDTPAHNYLASHLAESLFKHGRIISWANGWWAGFPMFQYYFCLPYILAALLDLVLPFNIALKLISVVGIYGLPFAAYAAARHLKAPRPIPTLASVAAVLQLCDTSHTMWGVNCYSTLAGMIANSISFPIMLLFIAHATHDAAESRFRVRTVLLLTALLASHFFTSLMAILMLAIVPLLQPRRRRLPALGVLFAEGITAALLMSWWLIPLIAKSAYAVDFGLNWDVDILRHTPPQIALLVPFIIVAIVLGIRRQIIIVPLATSMFVTAAVLFLIGFSISEVFVNVRLWPFMTFSLLLLGATGLGLLLANCKAPELGVAIALLAALTYGIQNNNDILNWSRWNYSGMEAKPNWKVFEELVLPLQGTPGRLANDLHPENDSMGSSRVFESVPHLIGKPILEGGIVNSAEGALFAYYIQSETSDNCAGFPPMVKPTTFDFDTATRHLELFNVKHFIARSDQTQRALAGAPEWKHLKTSEDWELYELTTHDGHYTFVPKFHPVGIKTEQWKTLGLEWIYTPKALDTPFALLPPNGSDFPGDVISEAEYRTFLESQSPDVALALSANRRAEPAPHSGSSSRRIGRGRPTLQPETPITHEEVTDLRIRFTTRAVGLPHIIKINHFPNWKVRGARGVYRVTPGFMLVYPEQPEVEIYYGYVLSDILGFAFSWLGLIILIVAGWGHDAHGSQTHSQDPRRPPRRLVLPHCHSPEPARYPLHAR